MSLYATEQAVIFCILKTLVVVAALAVKLVRFRGFQVLKKTHDFSQYEK